MGIFGGYSAGMAPGAIMPVAQGAAVPDGYLLCDGSELSRTLYPELFAVIGTTYGEGDGETTFNIPAGTIRLLDEKIAVVTSDKVTAFNVGKGNGVRKVEAALATSGQDVLYGGYGPPAAVDGYDTNNYVNLASQQLNLLIKYRW